jgi:4-amino-4-deoxy-L-arabinose transferase-like glycosyltransferase
MAKQPDIATKQGPLAGRRFWIAGGLLALLLVLGGLIFNVARPINGLHSWGDAHLNSFAKAHVRYGLGYTKGYWVWAVGDPPPQPARRYLDHPQLLSLVNGAFMAVLGVNDWSLRVVRLLLSVVTLLLLLKLFRGLVDDATALLAGSLSVVFPITWYFGYGWYEFPIGIFAMWCYLAYLGELKDTQSRPWHLWVLGAMLFLAIQMSWVGFFFAFGIGVHYVARCIYRRQRPRWRVPILIAAAAGASIALVFLHLIVGRGGDWEALYNIYKWRAEALRTAKEAFEWGKWFVRLGHLLVMDYTWPVLLVAALHAVYHCAGRIRQFLHRKAGREGPAVPRLIPHFWLFLLVPLSQQVLLKGALWHHQYWLQPLTPLIALAAASGIRAVWDRWPKANVAVAALVVLLITQCAIGAKYYFEIIQHPLPKIRMLQQLRDGTRPDQALLAWAPLVYLDDASQRWPKHSLFVVEEHPAKGRHYRPQIAWYLDREIVGAPDIRVLLGSPSQDPQEQLKQIVAGIQAKAATGKFRFYLMPDSRQLAPLINVLSQQYEVALNVPAVRAEPPVWPDMGMPMNRGSRAYIAFDLTRRR